MVWLTVLGRDGFWPVAILEDDNYKLGNVEASPRPIISNASRDEFKRPWPLFWRISCGFVFVLTAFFWFLLWKGSVTSSSNFMSLLAPVNHPCRSSLIAIIGWLLLTAILLSVWPWAVWCQLKFWPILFLSVAACVTALHCLFCARHIRERSSQRDATLFLGVAAALIASFVLLYEVRGHSQNLFLYRYIHLTSGVSPLLPLLCLIAAGLWWAWFSLSGLALLDKRHPRLPADGDLPSVVSPDHTAAVVMSRMWPSEEKAEAIMNIALPCTWHKNIYLPTLAVLVAALIALDFGHPLLSLEARHFEWAYAIVLGMVALAVFGTVFRLLAIWLECRRMLTTLDHFPLRRAFAKLNFTWAPFWRIGGARWQDLYRLISRQLETLEHLKSEIDGEDEPASKELVQSIKDTAATQNDLRLKFAPSTQANGSPQLAALDPRNRDFDDFLIDSYKDLQEQLAKTCASALKFLQPKWWNEEGLILCEVTSDREEKTDDDSPDVSLSTRLAERFVALVYLNFILSVILRMKTLTLAVGGLYIFLLLSVNSYPFEPKVSLRSAAILLLLFIAGMVGYVSAQVHRDSILSLTTHTQPGELGVAFWLRMGSFIALPLISLLVSQFPSLNNALFSWLEPAVNALK